MPPALSLLLHLAGYALLDLLLRRGRLDQLLARFGAKNDALRTGSFVGVCLLASPLWGWDVLRADAAPLRVFAFGLTLLLTWNATTRDFDPVGSCAGGWLRFLLAACCLLVLWSPCFVVVCAFVLSSRFSFWLHHATFPMRTLQALSAHLFLSGLTQLTGLNEQLPTASSSLYAGFITFLVMLQVSHYFITALAKMHLGPKWYSWVWDNRLHHLVASSYSWGWARFVPWNRYRHLVFAVKNWERPLQALAFGLELLAPLALLSAASAKVLCLAFALFHCGVFLLSGLLFWDWIITDLLLYGLLTASGGETLALALNPAQMALSIVLLVLFPLRHKLWKPMPLGWFDTPLTARIHWLAVGRSGKIYQIYNNFMCPHERLYGRVHGCFFAPYPVVSYHLGEVWKPELRRAIAEAGPDHDRLEQIRTRFGILPRESNLQTRHLKYLQAFFAQLNSGAKKHVFSPRLRFLKAPGDQIYYWGDLPAYRRQEPVAEVRLRFVEEYFDGEAFHRLADEEVARTVVPNVPPDAQPELTPKELDRFLLGLAEGRLIDLPLRKKTYAELLSEL